MTDTPTIALYYREHDPMKRKMFLDQSIAAGEDEEANAVRKELWELRYGELEYRSLKFETEVLDMGNYQGNAVVNYTDYEVPYTRIIEHKHFEFGTQPKTVITREYPAAWEKGKEPYYPVNDPKNSELFDKYERRALEEKNVIFGGRLGMYRYMDMDQVIEEALSLAETELTYEEP